MAEVGTGRILREILSRLRDPYSGLWEGPGTVDQTGIAILLRTASVPAAEVVATQRPTTLARPRCVVARLWLRGIGEPIILAMNHWKSRMQQAETNDREDRMETARWLGDLLSAMTRETCVIVMGDFNAEPFEAPFSSVGLRGVRFHSSALWSQATPAYLYNCAWRHLPQPDTWEVAGMAGYVESRPKTSHDASPPVVLDHVMVSGRALRGGPLRLLESTVA